MVVIYIKADEVTRDPCSICAEKMGEKVICTTGDYIQLQRIYFPNKTILNKVAGE